MSDGSPSLDHGQATLARGASIGRYVVLGLVGRGGMGEVYAAYDPELDRKVAVKLLRVKPGAGVSLTEGRQRTLREAQAIARLSHPNVVVVYDVGTFEEKVFIAMEFVEGHTAGFWAQSQHRTWQETLKVYLAAGRGLAAAHEKGLVHRDFKPDNVMVSRDGQVRVMDFGLARQAEKPVATNGGAGAKMVAVAEGGVVTTQRLPAPLGEPGAPVAPLDGSTLVLTSVSGDHRPPEFEASTTAMFDQRLTRTGAMMGTPAYMAPEQFRGRATDARSDQFAFCIALYEALYGERPFGGNTLMALTTNVVNGRIREMPSNADVPPWIRKILLRGLRVNADERFPSMFELLEALGKNPAVARRRWLVATSAMLLAVGLGFGMRQGMADPKPACGGGPERLVGIWELMAPGAGETPRQAQLHAAFLKTGKSYAKDVWATTSRSLTNYARAWTDMYKETCEAAVVNKVQSPDVMDLRMDCLNERLGGLRALTDVFSDANGEVVENAVSASNALASLDRCADVPVLRAVVKPAEDTATRQKVDELRKRLADLKAKFDAGRWTETIRDAPRLVEETRHVGYRALSAEMLSLYGFMLSKANEGDMRVAEDVLTEAYWVADSARHDEVRAESATNLVFLTGVQLGHHSDAIRWSKIAGGVLQRMGEHAILQSWLLNDVGCVYQAHGDGEAAVRAEREALLLKEKALGSDHPDLGISEGNLGLSLQLLGRNMEALEHIDRSIRILEKTLGAEHPELANQLSNRGEVLNTLGRHSDARRSFQRAGRIWEHELGANNLNLAFAFTGIGISYVAEGSPVDALEPLERGLRLREQLDANPVKRGEARFALARALWSSNRDRKRARRLGEEARADFARAASKLQVAATDDWLRAH
jgi:serine/threonine protein kinase/tetratricopeptide (TPR) repeat protein